MDLDLLKNIYFATESNLDEELFLPVARHANSINCMTGYFSSSVFSVLARALAFFLSTKGNELKFIVSPNLSRADLEALSAGIQADENLIPLLFPGFVVSEESLQETSLQALSYLVATKGLEIRVALKKKGMFHSKVWICGTEQGAITIHGSVNATESGISHNFEQVAVNRSWESPSSQFVVEQCQNRFNDIWDDNYPGLKTIRLNRESVSYLRAITTNKVRDAGSLSGLIDQLLGGANKDYREDRRPQELKVPDWINYSTGPFSHQGRAIEAWFTNNGRGILSIATGGGKTLTALVAAALVQAQEDSLLVVITVPTVALLDQWASDIEEFGVTPLNARHVPAGSMGPQINDRLRKLRMRQSKTEVLVLTHDSMKMERIMRLLQKASDQTAVMIIGDEVHNLGSSGYQENALDVYKYRLGLSATYERQFDELGTQFLIDHFGKVVFEYGLGDAIGTCLVPFEYNVYEVELFSDEEEEWAELTHQIRKLSYASELPEGNSTKERWKLLCLKRRRIVEGAAGKVPALAAALPGDKSNITRSLIFCTDKQPAQLKSVNRLLTQRELNFHQVTAEETANKQKLASIIRSFDNGKLQVLTSKRVLDEGFNIPQTETAYILASNTVKRQWVQRLGRILRLSSSTGKTKAVVHDFIALPRSQEDGIDPDLQALIRGEIERVQFFNALSNNGLSNTQTLTTIQKLINMLESK